jgi:secreted trypsin-like serine protease
VLPELGFLDGLATRRGTQEVEFTVVGYGLQEVKPNLQQDRVRYRGTSQLVNLRSALTDGFNLHSTNSPGKGTGGSGTCFGDSGGPVFYGDSNVIVGITSFGLNANCKGADFAYRTDIANAQDFILGFL